MNSICIECKFFSFVSYCSKEIRVVMHTLQYVFNASYSIRIQCKSMNSICIECKFFSFVFYCSKPIRIVIVDDEDYEKKETFQVCLGQPYVVTADGEEPPPSPGGSTPEEERIRELGKPRLGMWTVGYFVNRDTPDENGVRGKEPFLRGGVTRLLKSEERWEKGLIEEGVTSLMKGEKRGGGREGGLQ